MLNQLWKILACFSKPNMLERDLDKKTGTVPFTYLQVIVTKQLLKICLPHSILQH